MMKHATALPVMLGLATLLATDSSLHATDLFWLAPEGGAFSDPANWEGDMPGPPGVGDTAIFDLRTTFTVTGIGLAAFDRLLVDAGTITFAMDAAAHLDLLSPSIANPALQLGSPDGPLLTIEGAGMFTAPIATIGRDIDTTGHLRLSGGALLSSDDLVQLGQQGHGTLELDGGAASARRLSAGDLAFGHGAITLRGGTTGLDVAETLTLGRFGHADLLVENGAALTADHLMVAQQPGGSGTVIVRGASVELDGLDLGFAGPGSLLLQDGATLITGGISTLAGFPAEAPGSGGAGFVQLRGLGTNWALRGELFTGDLYIGLLNPFGFVDVGAGARIDADGRIFVNDYDEGATHLRVELGDADALPGPSVRAHGGFHPDAASWPIDVVFADGVVPEVGDVWTLLAGSTGADTAVPVLPALAGGLAWGVLAESDRLRVAALPESCTEITNDCNANGIDDACEFTFGLADDCDGNSRPDGCDIADGAPDCNANGRLDACEIAEGSVSDCNDNGVPDTCEALVPAVLLSTPFVLDEISSTYAISIDGDELAVGAPGGPNPRVELFRRVTAGWTHVETLLAPPDLEPESGFGRAVALQGDRLVVSAPFIGATGAVIFYERGEDGWAEMFRFDPEPPPFGLNRVGNTVAIDGDWAIVSEALTLVSRYQYVHFFEYERGAWQLRQTELTVVGGGGFGSGVAISGSTAAATSPQDLRIWDREDDDVWALVHQETSTLIPPWPVFGDGTRPRVVIDGPWIAFNGRLGGGGAVFLKRRTGDGWTANQVVVSPRGEPGFGKGFDLCGDVLVVGDASDDDAGEDAGALFRFRNVDDVWTPDGFLLPAELTANDRLGTSVAIAGGTVVAMAAGPVVDDLSTGRAYVFPFGDDDCNDNGISDACEIAGGAAPDANMNGIPDECETCTSDLDGTGVVGFGDLLLVLSAWGPCPGCAADLTGDDVVNTDDLIEVMAAWGACPG